MVDKSNLIKPGWGDDDTSLRYMVKLAGPMIVTTISFTIMQLIDRFMVSRLGTAQLAAVPAAAAISFISGGFMLGVFSSVATYVSQCLGRGNKRECSSYFWQAVYMGLGYSAIVLAIGWPMAPKIFESLGQDTQVIGYEVEYFRIILCAHLVAVIVWASNQFFMGIHRPIVSMYSSMIAQVTNVAANYILIFGKFGFPEMGVAGAAWGTFIGVSVGAGVRMAWFLTGDTAKTFASRNNLRLDLSKMASLLRVGLPAGIELALNVAIWQSILYWLVGGFGKEQQAATAVVLSCCHVAIMPMVGLRYAITAAVGKAIGKGRYDVVARQTRFCLIAAVGYMLIVGIVFLIFRYELMGLWSNDDIVVQAGAKAILFAAVYQLFYGIRTVYSGALRGAGDTMWLALWSAVGTILVLGAAGMAIVKLMPELGSTGPWIAAGASVMVVSAANYMRFAGNKWKQIELFERREVAVAIEDEAILD